MRVLVFHGYLLRGTGSNVYNASVARALVELGHEVHLFCQDRRAAELPFVDATAGWEGGRLHVRVLREPVRCTTYVPDIAGLLPVYVRDEYEGFEVRTFDELEDGELDRYLSRNVEAVREVAELAPPDAALANHAVMGPAVLARALGWELPFAVKIHGSALEYTVRPRPERFLPYVHEGLRPARGVLVGSRHTGESLWSLVDLPGLREKTRLGPPGVDVESFRPRPAAEAAESLRELASAVEGRPPAWGGEAGAGAALRALDPERHSIVSYVGKLIVSKGVDLLVAAWPLVAARVPEARLCIVGFGGFRDGLGQLLDALERGDLQSAREIARRGRELEGGPAGELRYLAAFLDGLGSRREAYARAARAAAPLARFTGRLDHEELPGLLAACRAQVVPSTFPEAFGMVAVEAAASGALPISASHSGLAEVTATLSPALPEPLRGLLSFEPGPEAVEQIAERLVRWLTLDAAARESASARLAELARRRYGWRGVAEGVLAAASGRLSELPAPGEAGD